MKTKFLLICIFCLALSISGYSTHFMGGEITYTQNPSNFLQYDFTLATYLDLHSVDDLGIDEPTATLAFGDGNQSTVSRTSKTALPNDIYKCIYNFSHTYLSSGTYIVSYEMANRTAGILNMNNSGNSAFYIESSLVCNSGTLNNSISFYDMPMLLCEAGKPFITNIAVYDSEGDSIIYKMGVPKQSASSDVANYKSPNQVSGNASDFFKVYLYTGVVEWGLPELAGMYTVSVKTEEYRDGNMIGYVIRDYNIEVESSATEIVQQYFSDQTSSNFDEDFQLSLQSNEDLALKVVFSDSLVPIHSLTCYSELITKGYATAVISDTGSNGKKAVFTYNPDPAHIRNYAYNIIFRGVSISNSEYYVTDRTYSVYVGADIPLPLKTINGESSINFIAYPNPVNNQLNFSGLDNNLYLIEILNLSGEVIYNDNISIQKPYLSVDGLNTGIYQYRIFLKEEVIMTGKIIK